MDHEKIKQEFLRIKKLEFIPNIKADLNDGGAGNTFEHHLGVKENNSRDADFDQFEVKTKKYLKGKSPISLFTQRPSSNYDDNYMRDNWGVADKRYPNINRFSTSIYANRWSLVYKKHYMKIEVDRNNQRVYLVRADLEFNVIDRNVYWSFSDIQKGSTKLKNMFLVGVEVKNINDKEHYHFTDATVFTDYLGDQNFIDLIEQGVVRYDNRIGVYGPTTKPANKIGTSHNHGGGFRVPKNHIEKLYKTKIEIPKDL